MPTLKPLEVEPQMSAAPGALAKGRYTRAEMNVVEHVFCIEEVEGVLLPLADGHLKSRC